MNLKDKLHDIVYTRRELIFYPHPERYILSPTELLELKKEWAKDAYETGFGDFSEVSIGNANEIKEEYINSITL